MGASTTQTAIGGNPNQPRGVNPGQVNGAQLSGSNRSGLSALLQLSGAHAAPSAQQQGGGNLVGGAFIPGSPQSRQEPAGSFNQSLRGLATLFQQSGAAGGRQVQLGATTNSGTAPDQLNLGANLGQSLVRL